MSFLGAGGLNLERAQESRLVQVRLAYQRPSQSLTPVPCASAQIAIKFVFY